METPSVSKTERLAKVSRVLGILSLGLLTIPILFWLLLSYSGDLGAESGVLMLNFCFAALFLGSIIIGLTGCISALIALRKNEKHGENNRLKRIANISLVLNGLGVLLPPLFYFLLRYFP